MVDNTLLLRLSGPMQSWGTQSKLQLRRTDLFPSKSGVLGLLLACRGIGRVISHDYLPELNALKMGVRIDEPGTVQADYHTAGAKYGIRQPSDGSIKLTASTKLPEVQLSRRQYLWEASFLVALQGDSTVIAEYANAVQSPVWPPYLGRKSCIPSEPIFVATGQFTDLESAFQSIPYTQKLASLSHRTDTLMKELGCWIEDPVATNSPDTKDVYDSPQRFGYWNYLSRRIRKSILNVKMEFLPPPPKAPWQNPYGSEWDKQRKARLEHDGYLCVFCKSPAAQVHHTDYEDVRTETLRSLCELCHDACTMLEYAQGDHPVRVDPLDPSQHEILLEQIKRILKQGRQTQRRRELLSGKEGLS